MCLDPDLVPDLASNLHLKDYVHSQSCISAELSVLYAIKHLVTIPEQGISQPQEVNPKRHP